MKVIYLLLQIILIMISMVVLKERTEYDGMERLGRGIIYTALYNIIAAMILAIVGVYSLMILTIADILPGILLFMSISKKTLFWKSLFISRAEILSQKYILLILFAAGILYLGFPTNYMLGGRDPGLYYLNGIHIAQTGDYQYQEDTYLTEHYEELEDIVKLGYPGLYSDYTYGYSDKAGDITPQFMPMYSAAMAVGYSLGEIAVMIRVNGIITLLAFLMIYYFVRRQFSEKIALISVLLLVVSPAQLWYGRNSVSELLLQLFVFLSVDLYAQGIKKKKNIYAGITGCLLGLGAMDRMDAYILGVGLFAVLLYTVLFSWEKRKYVGITVFGYCVLGTGAFLYGMNEVTPYFYDHMKNGGPLSKILLLNVALLALTLVVYLGTLLYKKGKLKQSVKQLNLYPNYLAKMFETKKGAIIFFCVLTVVWIYAYGIRWQGCSPDDASYFAKHNTVELSWYVSPLIMVLAILGLTGVLYKNVKQRESLFLFLAIGLSNYIGYGIQPSITSDQIWAARRWVPIIIPFLIVMGVVGISYLYQWFRKKKRTVGVVLCGFSLVVLFGFMLYQSKAFMFVRIMENLDTQMEELANQLEPDMLYITNNEEVASYLHYVYNKKVYCSSMDSAEAVEEYISKHQELGYIGTLESLDGLDCKKELQFSFETQGQFLEKKVGSYPKVLYNRTREASVYYLTNDAVY